MKKLIESFTEALLLKCQGDMSAAARFIENYPELAKDVKPTFRDVLRRGMFMILRAHIE